MEKRLEKVYLKRNHKLMIESAGQDEKSKAYGTSFFIDLNANGFTLSKDALDKICNMPSHDIVELHKKTMPVVKEMIGSNREYRSFYPNFPQDILSLTEAEQYFDQILHYVGAYFMFDEKNEATMYLPDGKKEERLPMNETHSLVELDAGTEKDFYTSMKRMMQSQVALSEHDIADLNTLFEVLQAEVIGLMPETIPNKENLASISRMIHDVNKKEAATILHPYYKTATDVLRFATALSEGDVSLTENTKFKLNKAEQRLIMGLLEKCNNLEEDMDKNKERFKKLAHTLHIGSYSEKYVRTFTAMQKLRDNAKIDTYMGRIQQKLLEGDVTVLEDLKHRPGIFAEKLNEVVRKFDEKAVLDAFESVADRVSIPVLIRLENKFMHNMNDKQYRVFLPKGKPRFCELNTMENLSEDVIARVGSICRKAMIDNFRNKETLGKVYVDRQSYEGLATPTKLREKKEGSKFIAEGSQIKCDEGKNVVRSGVWWTNIDGDEKEYMNCVDLDLSATFYDSDFHVACEAAYYTDRGSGFYTHSGDIVNGGPVNGKGVAEFIDFDKKACKEIGIAYITLAVNIYSGPSSFREMKNASFLLQQREDAFTGREYEPEASEIKMDLNGNTSFTVPVVYDVEKDAFIWLDRNISPALNNHHALAGLQAEVYNATQMHYPQLLDLVDMHTEARAEEIVDDPLKADIVFADKRGDIPENIRVITPYDVDVFVGEYLDDINRPENVPERIVKEKELQESLDAEKKKKEDKSRWCTGEERERKNDVNM